MTGRYTVDLDALMAFTDRLARFNARAEEIAAAVDQCVAELHDTWAGLAAKADVGHHEKWMEADQQMRQGLEALRKSGQVAHRNYSEVVKINSAMWP